MNHHFLTSTARPFGPIALAAAMFLGMVSPGLSAAEATKEPLEPWSEPAALRAISGTWTFGKGTIAGATDAGDVFGRLEDRAADFELEADVTLADGRGAAALVFRATPGMDGLYAVTLDHGASVVRLFKWPDATILRDVPFVFRPARRTTSAWPRPGRTSRPRSTGSNSSRSPTRAIPRVTSG